MEVYNEVCFCPMIKDVKLLPCINPPTANYLLEIIVNMIEQNDTYVSEEQANSYKRLATQMRRSTPDKEWMLRLLATLHPTNEVF